jgi:hypothetical protein
MHVTPSLGPSREVVMIAEEEAEARAGAEAGTVAAAETPKM